METPPIEFLTDSFVYKEFIGTDTWSDPIYKDPVIIRNARIDSGSVYSVAGKDKTLLYNALIFCYSGKTEPFMPIKEQSLIIDDEGFERKVVRIEKIKQPLGGGVYAYEIEVV